MGGNALRNCVTKRRNKEEYFSIESMVNSSLQKLFPHCRIHTIEAYRNKESFGDLDILISSDELPSNWVILVTTAFNSMEFFKNGNVLSFEYLQFQVDLIVTDPSEMESSISYFAFNDLSNLIGRVAHMLGLKLGHDGLSYNWRIDTYQFRNVVLSTDFKEILPVLGYSAERYTEGFDDLEDIFKFVVSSKFFNKDIFLLQNRNHTSRVRDAKRKTYTEFLDWIEVEGNVPDKSYCVRYEDKKEWLPYLFNSIKGFKETYNEVQLEWDMAVEFKRRYNGDLVKQYTGLSGKELGEFMSWMKNSYGEQKLISDILSVNETLIEGWVCYFKDKYLTEKQNESD